VADGINDGNADSRQQKGRRKQKKPCKNKPTCKNIAVHKYSIGFSILWFEFLIISSWAGGGKGIFLSEIPESAPKSPRLPQLKNTANSKTTLFPNIEKRALMGIFCLFENFLLT